MASSQSSHVTLQMGALQGVAMVMADSGEDEMTRLAAEEVEEAVSDEVFATYRFKEVIPGCLPHPGDIVESGSLAAIEPPAVTYPLSESFPDHVIRTGKLSALQLEGIVHACQRHQVLLSGGQRAGFFLGDAAGVGKGRQIAGIMLDGFARRRTKHVWFSISSDLIVDARRDLADIDCHIKVIEGCQHLDKETKAFGLSSGLKEGILFCTYATLVSSTAKGGHFSSARQSRLQQIVDWCGGETFDGCLVFDECHKAKHFVPGNEQASSKVAMAVCNIQKMLPKARVVYCSATGVSGVKNMAFMERLGLWGEGAAFKSFENFLEAVHKKGLGLAEMLALDMKSSGIYLSRSLSFKQAEFSTVEVALTPNQIKMYNISTHVWSELHRSLVSAVQRTVGNSSRVWSTYWAAHQRYFKQLCLGLKVDAIVSEVRAALDSGQAVVIGLQTTGEASLQSEVAKNNNKNGEAVSGFVSLCREILTRFIQGNFPTILDEQNGKQDDWCCTAKQMLLEHTQKMPLPNSCLDELIDKLGGPGAVAEMTGRRARIVRPSPTQPPQYQLRDAQDQGGVGLDTLNVRERNAFMSGQKLIAIISDAASTGISLHADSRACNQRRRVHLTVELAWSADKAVQQLGRSHRSNQTSGPLYKLLTTELGGERRFAAAVAHRLQSLGALTKGDRRAASGSDLAEFNFDTPYGRSALRLMYNAICQKALISGVNMANVWKDTSLLREEFNAQMLESLQLMDVVETETLSIALKVKDKEATDVGRFLNRILGLRVDQQKLIFSYFIECLNSQIAGAKKEGRYNEGLVDIVASSVVMVGEPRPVFKKKSSQLNPTLHVTVLVDRGLTWERAVTRLDAHPGPDNGFYCARRDVRGKHLYILATLKDCSGHLFKIGRPNTGVSNFDEEKADLLSKYRRVPIEDAELGWKEQYEESKELCIHGPRCRLNAECTVGTRCYKMHLLCGGMMNLMSVLELTMMRYAAKLRLSKAECSLRVVRVQLDSGQRVIGLRYPLSLIHIAESAAASEELAIRNFLLPDTMRFATQATSTSSSQGGPSQGSRPYHPQHPGASAQTGPSTDPKNGLMAWTVDPDLAAMALVPTDVVVRPPIIEPVSPVNVKCLQRATTAPPTIRSFFSKSTKQSVSESDPSGASENCEQELVPVKDCNVDLQQNAAAVTAEENTEETGLNSKECESLNSGDKTVKELVNSAKTDKSRAQSTSEKKCSDNKKLIASAGNMPVKSSAVSAKRASDASQPASKKVKQCSILASFQRKPTAATALSNSNACPICGVQFLSTLSNTEINKHMDSCLIK